MQGAQHQSRARKQLGFLLPVRALPQAVRQVPLRARKPGSTIDSKPVWRIMPLEITRVPGDAELAEHFKVSAGISGIGVKKRAIPIEQHHSRWKTDAGHRKEIVAGKWKSRVSTQPQRLKVQD